jgi:hypothetical protein
MDSTGARNRAATVRKRSELFFTRALTVAPQSARRGATVRESVYSPIHRIRETALVFREHLPNSRPQRRLAVGPAVEHVAARILVH